MGSWSGGGGTRGRESGLRRGTEIKDGDAKDESVRLVDLPGLWGEASSDSASAVNYALIAAGRGASVRGRKPTKAPPGVVSPPRLFRRLILPQ